MGYACREVEGTADLLCTFPGGHWIRANIQCGHRKVVCLFKQETSEGARWPLWKRGRNPTTRHRSIASQPASYIYKHPATIASLWSEGLLGLLGPTNQIVLLVSIVTTFDSAEWNLAPAKSPLLLLSIYVKLVQKVSILLLSFPCCLVSSPYQDVN